MTWDAVVVGGGAAGLGTALGLARARRSVLVVDGGFPRNAPASGVHGFLTRDGVAPGELARLGSEEVHRYGGVVRSGEVVGIDREEGRFALALADGSREVGRTLVWAAGLVDELPDVPGLAERWGRDVLHCPYCHGWEVQDRRIGVLGTSDRAVHQALLWSQWSSDVLLLQHIAPPPDADARRHLHARGVRLVEGRAAEVLVVDDRLTAVRLDDATEVPLDALVVASRMQARAELLEPLGLRAVSHPLGSHLPAEPDGCTAVPGVFVVGNATDLGATVVMAAAQGARAAHAVNHHLLEAEAAV